MGQGFREAKEARKPSGEEEKLNEVPNRFPQDVPTTNPQSKGLVLAECDEGGVYNAPRSREAFVSQGDVLTLEERRDQCLYIALASISLEN